MKAIFLGCIIASVYPAHPPDHAVTVKINGVTVLKSFDTVIFPDIRTCQDAINTNSRVDCIEYKPGDHVIAFGGKVTTRCLDSK